MAHSDFSWRKIFSFFGVGILFFVAIVSIANGLNVLVDGATFYEVISLIAGIASIVLAILLYKNYQKWAKENLTEKNIYNK